jgi:hypothetical protein
VLRRLREEIVSSDLYESIVLIEGWTVLATFVVFLALAIPVRALTGSLILAGLLAYSTAYLVLLLVLVVSYGETRRPTGAKGTVLTGLSLVIGGGSLWLLLTGGIDDPGVFIAITQTSLIFAATGQRRTPQAGEQLP